MPIPERLNPTFASARPLTIDFAEEARKRLIVALDVPDAASALALVGQLEKTCHWFKVGLELFVAAGPAVIEPLVARGHSVFLDLKLHDIPNTVAGAVRSAAAMGVKMMTLHAAGGPAMLSAARAALNGASEPPELLAVTVLTSMDQAQVNSTGLDRSPAAQVELLARMGIEVRNSRLCLLAAGGGRLARANWSRGRTGHPRHSSRKLCNRRSEAHRHSRRGPPPGRKLPCRRPPHNSGSRPGRGC